MQIYIYKLSSNKSVIWSQFKELIDRIHTFINIFSYSLMKTIQYDVTTKTFVPAKKYLLTFLRFSIKTHIFSSSFTYFKYLEVHLLERRNSRQISSLVYSKYQYKCEQCTNRATFQPVCHNRSIFPIYLSRGCSWICHLCYSGFVKSNEGQHGCSKCPTD